MQIIFSYIAIWWKKTKEHKIFSKGKIKQKNMH